MTEHDLFYLRSILHNLDEFRQISLEQYGIANDALEDNRDWLDCFIARFERSATAAALEADAAQ